MTRLKLTVYAIDGVTPVVDPTAFVHPSAVLIGDVYVGPGCYVGPCASLRGDFGHIEMHAGSNVQDGCVMHGFPGTGTIVAEDGHIGHGAVLHGCRIERNALVGMNAVVNDNAVVGESAIVAAMAFVKAGMIVPPRTIDRLDRGKRGRDPIPGRIDRRFRRTARGREPIALRPDAFGEWIGEARHHQVGKLCRRPLTESQAFTRRRAA